MANNKVQLSNGTVLMDITDTTATASDVASGKYFYNAAGIKVSGTSSGGGGGTAIITDETDIHGGTIRTITTTSEVYLQSKSATPSTSSQSILPDSGFDALSQVNISPIPSAYIIPSGTLSITENGTYDVGSYASADINVAGGGGGISIDDIAEKTLSGNITGSASLIKQYTFYMCSQLSGASFPNCTNIGSWAFYFCSNLSSISFPSCTWIGGPYAFASCYGLTEIDFPLCSFIGSSTFISCWYLTSAYFPKCSSIGSSAFYACTSLKTISFPKCERIESYAFTSCRSLTEANFPSCTYIGAGAFSYCSGLESANFPLVSDASTTIFQNCSKLKTINIPNLSIIRASAFSGCRELKEIAISSCNSIANSAFYGCYSLSNISFPICTFIGANAFGYCSSLEQIILPSLMRVSGAQAFAYCSSVTTIILGYSASTTGSCYFSGTQIFRNCIHLASIYLLAYSVYSLTSTSQFTSTAFSDYTIGVGGWGSIFVPSSLYDSYISANNWSVYSARFSSLTDAQIQNVIQYGTHNP